MIIKEPDHSKIFPLIVSIETKGNATKLGSGITAALLMTDYFSVT